MFEIIAKVSGTSDLKTFNNLASLQLTFLEFITDSSQTSTIFLAPLSANTSESYEEMNN